jgi:hypothetical protein
MVRISQQFSTLPLLSKVYQVFAYAVFSNSFSFSLFLSLSISLSLSLCPCNMIYGRLLVWMFLSSGR